MPDGPTPATDLRPASREEVLGGLAFALRADTHARSGHGTTEFVAALAAQYLLDHLADAGFVLMRKPLLRVPQPAPCE